MSRFITSFEEIGRAEGRAEGRVEGQREERQAMVLRQLNRKVGPLASELQTRIAALAPETLLLLSEALLNFADQRDLIAWLEQHP